MRKPLSLSLDEIKAMPARTQVTQHNCDEGWTAIGQWTGVPLAHVLGMAPNQACGRATPPPIAWTNWRAHADGSGFYYESIDLFDVLPCRRRSSPTA